MKRNHWMPMVAALVALVLVGWKRDDASEMQSAPIGFVDLNEVLAKYKKNDELSKNLKDLVPTLMAPIEEQRKTIAVKREELQMLKEGSEEYGGLQDAIAELEWRLEYDGAKARASLERKKVDGWKELYADVGRAAESVARQKNVVAIYIVNREAPEGKKEQEIVTELSLRRVLYFDPALDFTDDVVEVLNR